MPNAHHNQRPVRRAPGLRGRRCLGHLIAWRGGQVADLPYSGGAGRPRLQPRASGFTLVEVIVATLVLAIGLLAALTAFSMAARVVGASTNDTLVAFLAQQKLAQIQLLGQRLPSGTTTGDFAPGYPDYFWELTVGRPDPLHLIRVDLIIYAPEAGKTRAVRFSTMVS